MILEGLDGLLGAVTAVVVGWDELICHLVALYCFLELVRATADVAEWLDQRFK